MEELMNVDEALNALKEGAVIKDLKGAKFIFKKNKVFVYYINSSFSVSFVCIL